MDCIQFRALLAFLHDTSTFGFHNFSASVARGDAPYANAIDLIHTCCVLMHFRCPHSCRGCSLMSYTMSWCSNMFLPNCRK